MKFGILQTVCTYLSKETCFVQIMTQTRTQKGTRYAYGVLHENMPIYVYVG